MADALTIDFALTNWNRVEKAFNSLSKMSSVAETRMKSLEAAVDSAAGAYSRLNAEIALFNRLTGGSGGGRPGGPSGGSVRSARSSSYVQGPFQRQEKLAGQLQSALGSGNRRAAVDIRLAQIKNDAQIAKISAPPKTFNDKLMDVVKTSRFSLGTGKAEIMPLVGKTMGLIGEVLSPELMALAGPVGLVVGAATEAAKAVFDLAKNAAEAGNAFSSFQFAIGSNGATAGAALATGRLAGLSADATASQASALQSGITGSAYGRAVGMKYGVFNLEGPYGNQELGGQYDMFMKKLKASGESFQDKVRDARAVGVTGSLGFLNTSAHQDSYASGDAATHNQIFDQSFATKSADFDRALGRVSDAASNLMTVLGKPFMDSLTSFFNLLASAMNGLAVFLNGPIGKTILAGLSPLSAMAMAGSAVAGDNTANAQLKATQEQTKATTDLTGAINGTYGRDPDGRLAGAMPGAAGRNADARSRNPYVSGAIQLGGFV